jgi:hypothetical protein
LYGSFHNALMRIAIAIKDVPTWKADLIAELGVGVDSGVVSVCVSVVCGTITGSGSGWRSG